MVSYKYTCSGCLFLAFLEVLTMFRRRYVFEVVFSSNRKLFSRSGDQNIGFQIFDENREKKVFTRILKHLELLSLDVYHDAVLGGVG